MSEMEILELFSNILWFGSIGFEHILQFNPTYFIILVAIINEIMF